MHILQPLLDTSELIRSRSVFLVLATISVISMTASYFFAQGSTDWLRRSLSFLLAGGVGAMVLIALGKILYSSLFEGAYAFGAIFTSLAALFTLFAIAVLAAMSVGGRFQTPFLFLSLVASLLFSLILSTAVILVRRLLS